MNFTTIKFISIFLIILFFIEETPISEILLAKAIQEQRKIKLMIVLAIILSSVDYDDVELSKNENADFNKYFFHQLNPYRFSLVSDYVKLNSGGGGGGSSKKEKKEKKTSEYNPFILPNIDSLLKDIKSGKISYEKLLDMASKRNSKFRDVDKNDSLIVKITALEKRTFEVIVDYLKNIGVKTDVDTIKKKFYDEYIVIHFFVESAYFEKKDHSSDEYYNKYIPLIYDTLKKFRDKVFTDIGASKISEEDKYRITSFSLSVMVDAMNAYSIVRLGTLLDKKSKKRAEEPDDEYLNEKIRQNEKIRIEDIRPLQWPAKSIEK